MTRTRRWATLVIWLLVGFMGLRGVGQEPATLTVCVEKSDTCQYTSVQEAADAAKLGDTVQIAPGTYTVTSPITLTKSLKLSGTGKATDEKPDPTQVVLKGSGQDQHHVLVIQKATNVRIENLTVRDGRRGVSISESTDVIIENLIVADSGSGIAAEGSKALILATTIRNNAFSGIQLDSQWNGGPSETRVENATIDANVQVGVLVLKRAAVKLTKSKISNTRPLSNGDSGYGIWLNDQSSALLDQTVIDSNVGYGILVRQQASVTVLNTSEINNTQARPNGSNGVGIGVVDSAQVTVENSTINNNMRNGITIQQAGRVTLRGATVSGSQWGISIGFPSISGETWQLISNESTIVRNQNCGLSVDGDVGGGIVGSNNTGGQTRNAPNACGPGTNKIPSGFWK